MENNMKLSEYLIGIGKPVAYYPGLRKITDSTNATIFLCQFIYWTGKESSQDGWIYKTSDEIEEETGLSYDEQKTAREKLKQVGLLHERYARLEHQMYFKINLDTLNEKWGKPEGGIPEHGEAALAKAESPYSLNDSENTTKNTTDIKQSFSKEKIKEIAENTEARILAGMRGAESSWPGREKMPEPIRDLLDVFVKVSGIKPTKGQLMDWLGTGNDWLEIGAHPQDISKAYDESRPNEKGFGGFACYRPGSLTGAVQKVVGERQKGHKERPGVEQALAEIARMQR